jgi:hypothetical protein
LNVFGIARFHCPAEPIAQVREQHFAPSSELSVRVYSVKVVAIPISIWAVSHSYKVTPRFKEAREGLHPFRVKLTSFVTDSDDDGSETTPEPQQAVTLDRISSKTVHELITENLIKTLMCLISEAFKFLIPIRE